MHRLLPLGIALAFVGSWLGFVPVTVNQFKCGSIYRPKTLAAEFGGEFPAELRGLTENAFGSVNEACAGRRRMMVYPMASIIVAGIGAAVAGGVAWRRAVVTPVA